MSALVVLALPGFFFGGPVSGGNGAGAAPLRRSFSEVWNGAVARIGAGEIRSGFLTLDSLRRSTPNLDDSLLVQYARLVSDCFLPDTTGPSADSIIEITAGGSSGNNRFLESDEEIPEGQCWTVITADDSRRVMPSFSWDRQFNIHERMKLRLPPLGPWQHPETADLLSYGACMQVPPGPLMYNPGAEPWKVHLKIVVDCSGGSEQLSDYVGNLVITRYDYITVKKEPSIRNSLSLRCYNQQVFHNRPGAFCGLVAFDRYGVIANKKPGARRRQTGHCEPFKIRYLVLVKANRAIEERAELILQSVLERFKHPVN